MLIKYIKSLSGFQRVLTALALGVIVGVVVGEPAGYLKIVGSVYVGLLQMTVLPYVLVSIVSGLAKLDGSIARDIGIRAGLVLLFVWLSTMLTLCLMPLAFPQWETAGFFSTSLVAEKEPFDFLSLFIPSNIFQSLSNTTVPAVVLFCLLLGTALISVPNKDTLIDLSENISDGLMKVASFVTNIAPVGVFAICASAAGTLQPDELGKLQIYLWVYMVGWLLLAFVALPVMIHLATPFSYRELMKAAGEAMVTAIATGTVLVVLPMIAERCKALLADHKMEGDQTSSVVDVMVPTSYSFPSVGSIMGLGFILFSGWYVGNPVGLEDYPIYTVMGVLTAFGGITVALPFLLDLFSLPADQFQLYLLGTVVWGRSSMGLAALHGVVVSLLVSAAVLKLLNWKRLFIALGLHLGISAGIMIALGLGITTLIPYQYKGDESFESLGLYGKSAEVKTIDIPPAMDDETLAQPRLKVIAERGSIRAGFWRDSLPFAFPNNEGAIVGLDMDMMHSMALDMGAELHLVDLDGTDLKPAELLNQGRIDFVIGGIGITPSRASRALFTDPYGFHSVGIVVPDAVRGDYSNMERIRLLEGVRVGVPDISYYKQTLKLLFPNSEIVYLQSAGEYFKTIKDYFNQDFGKVDVFVGSAEASAAWTLLHPEFSVVVPEGLKVRVPMGLMMPKGQLEMAYFLNTWLKIKKDEGFQQQIYDYWILGHNPQDKQKRWSVLQNVFGWDY